MRRMVWAYALVLAIGSLQPERPDEMIHHGPLHRLLHVGCFGLLAVLSQMAFKDRKWLPLILVACVGFGATLEFSQCLIYGIHFEWDDLRDDTIGTGIGLIGGALMARFRPG